MEIIVKIFQIVFFVVTLGSGIITAIWMSRLSRKVFLGQESSLYKRLGISLLSGISVCLLFVSVALIAGILDTNYQWTKAGITGVGLLALAIVIIATIGSFWQFFIVGRFRSHLFRKLHDKNKDK
jgi:hypothetical protein